MRVPFLSEFYESRSVNFDAQRLINLYQENSESGSSESGAVLYGTPGLKLFSTLASSNGNRGLYTTSKGRCFTVIGNTLYELFDNGSNVSRGTLNTSEGTVIMTDNLSQLMIVDGSNGYILTLVSSVLTQITDTDFPTGPTHVAFLDQYFIVNDNNTQNFYISALNDGTSWNALDFGSVESSPDVLRSLLVNNQNIWLFGDKSIEVFYDSGASTFPFVRVPGGVIEIGVFSRYSVAKMNSSVYWLGNNNEGGYTIYKTNGYQPVRISTHPIEKKISELVNPNNSVGYSYQQEGHFFYVLSFIDGEMTFVFDEITGKWHERAFLEPLSGNLKKHRALNHSFAFGKNLVGDFEKPLIYEYDLDTYTDNGDEIARIGRTPYVSAEEKRVFHKSIEIVMETGVGLTV